MWYMGPTFEKYESRIIRSYSWRAQPVVMNIVPTRENNEASATTPGYPAWGVYARGGI